MNERPKLKIILHNNQRFLEYAGWIILMALWIILFVKFSSLPSTIPIHYDGEGKVDVMATKATYF